MSLDAAASRAAKLIRSRPTGTRWFLDCDSDADGLTAAVVMARALGRIGHRFQVRASRDKTADAYADLAHQECDGLMLLDKGTSHVAALAQIATANEQPVIIIDHHNVPDADVGDVILVNPRLEDMDGSRDASAATTAVAVALALDAGNLDLAPIGLSGAVGDWQHHGGWQGWNAELVDRALATGHASHRHVPALIGVDLAEALTRAGIPDAAQWLANLDIDATQEAEDLDTEAATRLLSAWTLWDLEHGTDRVRVHEVLWNERLGLGVRHAFRIVDACGRLGKADTGVAFLMGSTRARDEAAHVFADYKQRLGHALRRLHEEGTTQLEALQWHRTGEAALTGMVAGIGMVHTVPTRLPLVVCAPRPDGMLQVSTRGAHEQVEAGMDLGAAIQEAAAAVGAEGGGHPIASGTVVPEDAWQDLLGALDAALKRQGFLGDA